MAQHYSFMSLLCMNILSTISLHTYRGALGTEIRHVFFHTLFWREHDLQIYIIELSELGTHHICGCIVFINVNLLSPSARGTTQHNQHTWTCAEHHRAVSFRITPATKWN